MAFFPSTVPTVLNLLQAKNNKSVTLTAAINDSLTTIPVSDTSELPASGYVTSGDGSKESIYYASKTASTLESATRGADGTTASSHASGSTLEMWGNAAYHNLLAEEIIAVAQNLSNRIGLSTTQILAPLGSASLPTYSFTGDPNTGAYSSSADIFDIATAGTRRVHIDSAGITIDTGAVLTTDGSGGSPSFSFQADNNTGWYRSASGEIQMVNDGALVWKWNATGQVGTNNDAKIYGAPGSAASPTYSFAADANTGIYNSNPDQLTLVANGATILSAFSSKIESHTVHLFQDGSASSPSISFVTDIDTGIYRVSSDVIGFSIGGSQKAQFDTTGLTMTSTGGSGLRVYGGSGAHQWDIYLSSNNLRFSDNTTGGAAQFDTPIFAASGSSSSPSYTFTSNSSSGFYLSATNEISIALGASRIAIFDSAANRFRVLRSAAGAEVSTQVFNSDNTNTSSNAKMEIFAGGSSGGDAFLVMGVSGVTNWAFGVDNSDSDCINLTEGATLGGVNTRLRMPSGGQLQMGDGSVSSPQYSFINDPNTGIYSGGSDILSVAVGGSQIANFSSNGLTMTSTGGSGLRIYGSSGTHQWDIYLNSTNIRFGDNTSGGSVVFDTPINIGNTVNVVSPTSPNRTITLIVGGTTYYVHAKTTND